MKIKRIALVAAIAAAPFLVTSLATAKGPIVETDAGAGPKATASSSASPSLTCEDKAKKCNDDLASCQASAAELEKLCASYVEKGSDGKWKPKATASSSAAIAPSTTTPPPKPKFTCVDTGTTVEDPAKCTCPKDKVLVTGKYLNERVCVVKDIGADLTALEKKVTELEKKLATAPTGADLDALKKEIAELKNKVFRLERITDGVSDAELPGILQNLRNRLTALEGKVGAMAKALCGIENLADPKWTPQEIEKQCTDFIDLKVQVGSERTRPNFLVRPGIAMASGPMGMQVATELDLMYEFGYSRVRGISGVVFGGVFSAPRTGGQVYVWPRAGVRVYTDERYHRNAWAFDFTLGVKQHFTTLGHNPTISGVTYDAGVPWGTFATFGVDANIVATSWLQVGVGGWLGPGWMVNTAPEKPSPTKLLNAGQGWGGGGHLRVSFVF